MPKYRVTLSDGRKVTVEAAQPPSEADVLGALGGETPAAPAEPVAPEAPPSQLSEFASGLVSPITGLANAVAHPIETGRGIVANINRAVAPDALEQMAAQPRMSAGRNLGVAASTIFGPRLVSKAAARVPAAVVRAGEAVERGGKAMTPTASGLAGTLVGGPAGAVVGVAAPSLVRGTGRLMQRTGRALESRVPIAAETAPIAEAAPLAAELPPPMAPAEPGPMLGPQPKPKLTAQETVAMLRDMHGSEQAGKMLWGKVQKTSGPGSTVSSAAARQAAIKRLTPEGVTKLPSAPTREIAARLATSTPADALAYANKAPNAIARDYFGDQLTGAAADVAPGSLPTQMTIERAIAEAQLRQALLARMQAK